MIENMIESIDELADKYELSEETVQRTLLDGIGGTLSKVFGYEVEAMFDETGALKLYGYHDFAGNVEVREFDPEKLKKNIVRLIKFTVAENLIKKSVIREYDKLKGLIGCVKNGMIIRQGDFAGDDLYVELEGVYSTGAGVVAICVKKEQPVRERGLYYKHQILPFYVLRVEPVYENNVPRLEITLSRRSTSMVEQMLKAEVPDAKIKCTRRIAGAISEVETDRPLPREAIKKVGDELQERIKVTWRSQQK